MKKYIFIAAMAAMIPFFADAKISDAHIALGGVNPGSTEEYLLSTYGKPKTVKRTYAPQHGQYVKEYNYGDSFFVSVLESDKTVLHLMSLKLRNNIKTADGIAVGATLPELLAAYGYPDLRQIDGDVDYYWYVGTGEKGNLVFHVSYGKVVGIVCGKK